MREGRGDWALDERPRDLAQSEIARDFAQSEMAQDCRLCLNAARLGLSVRLGRCTFGRNTTRLRSGRNGARLGLARQSQNISFSPGCRATRLHTRGRADWATHNGPHRHPPYTNAPLHSQHVERLEGNFNAVFFGRVFVLYQN